MTSKLTRERLAEIAQFGFSSAIMPANDFEIKELARMALAAMDSEPHTGDELSNLLWYSQEATCHSDPNYYCEFQRLATPGLIAGIIRELQERRKVDSEPVAYTDERNLGYIDRGRETAYLWGKQNSESSDVALYRHAQPAPVSYSDFEEFWSAYIHPLAQDDELKDFSWGIWNACASNSQPAPVVPDGYVMVPKEMTDEIGEAIAMQANCCGGIALDIYDAMLAAAPQSPGSEPATVPGKWIPVSERMPEVGDIVLTAMGGVVNVGEMECSAANCRFFTSVISGRELPATYWMPLPAGPQEVR
ncbi:DUF551 domain-containing protein [Klebsiella quasipneumoniae subsp. similipneumoniae]